MDKAKTLLYDKETETETWHCLKCGKEIHEEKCKKRTKPRNITQKGDEKEKIHKKKHYSEHAHDKTKMEPDYEPFGNMGKNIEE